MNLQTHLPGELWSAISSAYASQNYSHAILEAAYFMSALIRDRAGVDGDGASLVGQALGGEAPKLRLNALQTESEKNIQKGFEQILRGIYIGIRNPRSHEPSVDSKETADAIIHFIGYIAKLLTSSREAFTADAFVDRAFDTEFVESARYAELIVSEVPKLRLTDAAISLFKARRRGELRKLRHLISALIAALGPTQLSAYLSTVSEEFRTATDDTDIRTALQMVTPEVWQGIDELPRLRIENKLIGGLRKGLVLSNGKTTEPLATWASEFLRVFTQKNEVAYAVLDRLGSEANARHYVAKFFIRGLPDVMQSDGQRARCIRALVKAVLADDDNISQALLHAIHSYPEDWQKKLVKELQGKTSEENPGTRLADGTAFLSSPTNEFDDDIPF